MNKHFFNHFSRQIGLLFLMMFISLVAFGQTVRKPIPEDQLPIPDYYGLYAVTDKGLMEMKTGTATIDVNAGVEFIYYAKDAATAEALQLFKVPPQSQSQQTPQRNQKFTTFNNFLNQQQNVIADNQAFLNGLPRDAAPIEIRGKSISGKPEMVRLIPSDLLSSGNYQLGTPVSNGNLSWYHFSVGGGVGLFVSPDSTVSEPVQQNGPPLKPLELTDSTNKSTLQQVGSKIQQNPAWPVIQRAIQANGGVQNIFRLSATKTSIKGKMLFPREGWVNCDITFYFKAGQLRQEASYQLPRGLLNQVMIYSEGNVQELNNGKSRTASSAAKESLKQETFMQSVEDLRPILEDGLEVKNDGNVDVDGKTYQSVTVISDDQFSVTLLFDSETGLLSRRRFERKNKSGKMVENEVVYSNFSTKYGIKIPGHIDGYENGELTSQSDVLEMTAFEEIPDAYFNDPSLTIPDTFQPKPQAIQ